MSCCRKVVLVWLLGVSLATSTMKQVSKFYLASFLKNQTYFVPILVIFFQDLGLSYTEIFWILTAGSIFSFILEIPTGVLADIYGRRLSIILSKFTIFFSFIAFGFSKSFIALLLANLLYELGKSFRSGTETAYVFDYLQHDTSAPKYTKVKATQKFYARISESIATAVGGVIAVRLGFNAVFFLAAIPAAINAIQTLTWIKIKDSVDKKKRATIPFLKKAFLDIWKQKEVLTIMINVLLYSAVFVAVGTFVQPYMQDVGLPLEYFGFVYSGFLIIVAFLSRSASDLEEKFGGGKMMNILTFISIFPLLILGLGYVSFIGIALLFFVLMVQNLRSPIANSFFHEHVGSDNRATMGSILALFQNSGNLVLLPLMGYVADAFSLYTALLILSALVAFTAVFFRVKQA